MPAWTVVTECPLHKKEVLLSIEASTSSEAYERAMGLYLPCPWGPITKTEKRVKVRILKDFAEAVFKFKAGEEHEVAVESADRWVARGYAGKVSEPEEKVSREPHFFVVERIKDVLPPWTPPATLVGPERKLGVISSVFEVPERPVTVPVPKEALYTMPRDLAVRLRGKTAWWKYEEDAEKLEKKWSEAVSKSFREHTEKLGKIKEEHERRLRQVQAIIDKAERDRKKEELKEWRLEKGKELESGLVVLWERAAGPVDAITVVQADKWKEIKDMMRRAREKQTFELSKMEEEEAVV